MPGGMGTASGMGAVFRWVRDLWLAMGAGGGTAGGGVHGGPSFGTGGIAGKVYYVDGINGLNANQGTRNSPWQTITHALLQCDHNHDDYILVLDCWDDEPAYPVVVNVDRVHIIGVANPTNMYPKMNPGAPGANAAVFQLGDGSHGQYCEIAGFDLMGAGEHGCIECNQARGGWIHHCWFGHDEASQGEVCRDGITLLDGNSEGLLIEACHFYGRSYLATPGILNYGIRDITAVGRMDYGTIRHNYFITNPDYGIYLADEEYVTIVDNYFAVFFDTLGMAITLAAGGECLGCLVGGNKALFDRLTAGMVNNPYRDLNLIGATVHRNHWMANYKGNALIDPA